MTITVNNLLRAGAMAQKEFDMREDYEIRLFPSDCPDTVRVYETPKPIQVGENIRPFFPTPQYDDVNLLHFAARYNSDSIRMGYSRGLNILCLSLI